MFRRIPALGFATLFLTLAACGPQYSGPPADLVVMNANVVTIDKDNPRAEAVAVIGEKIIAVTSNSAIEAYIGEGTEVIDAEGKLMIPGLNDAHAHYSGLDTEYIELRYITDKNIITEKVRERVAQVEPGVLIRGGHWEHEMFVDKQWPTKELLDEVAPEQPGGSEPDRWPFESCEQLCATGLRNHQRHTRPLWWGDSEGSRHR